jgi:hypothetical protein
MTRALALCLMLLPSAGACAQAEPEGYQGPTSMCGLEGTGAADLADKVRALKLGVQDIPRPERFEAYADETARPRVLKQWLITRPSEPAHPAVTCRRSVFEDGRASLQRSTRCEGPEAACEALMQELYELDQRAAQTLRGGAPSEPLVPEGVHTLEQGAGSMCGLTYNNAADLAAKVRALSTARQTVRTDRFEVYETPAPPPSPTYQWLITRSSEPAYPAVSCRYVAVEGGQTVMNRDMRCDADRAVCDALYLELQALDQRTAKAAQAK